MVGLTGYLSVGLTLYVEVDGQHGVQLTPERETHHFRPVPDFGSPAGKRLAVAYRRITHHFD